MSTCPPNLAQVFLTICDIITSQVDKNAIFPSAKVGQQSLKGLKKQHF
jgi:hypothetical protein